MNGKSKKTFLAAAATAAILLLTAWAPTAARPDEIPYRMTKLTDRIFVFQPGKHGNRACLAVVTTAKGLVIIDTGLTSSFAEQTKRKFREMFGRDDVLYVINTHSHWDHTGGNQVFSGTVIVGHENVVPALKRFVQNKSRFIEERRTYISKLERDLPSKDSKSEEAALLAERIDEEKTFVRELETSYAATPPSRTFADRMSLEAGDLTINLYYYSGCFSEGPRRHTDNDILIHIPALGALFTGDDAFFFYQKTLALRHFPDVMPRWLNLMGEILSKPVTVAVDGHFNLRMGSGELLALLYRYTKELSDAAIKAKRDGLDDRAFEGKNALAEKYAYLGKFYDLKSPDILGQHRENMRKFRSIS